MDAASPVDEALRCTSCSRQFNRPDHLRRHLQSHSDIRPFACCFCPLTFGRRDALIRHWKTCKQRAISGATTPPKLQCEKRGRKRIACDQCAKSKRKCSRKVPCDTCVQLGENCTVTTKSENKAGSKSNHDVKSSVGWQGQETSPVFINNSPSEPSASSSPAYVQSDNGEDVWNGPHDMQLATQEFSLVPVNSTPWTISKSLSPDVCPRMLPHSRLSFLLRFTASDGFATSFECGTSKERQQIMLALAGDLSLQIANEDMHNAPLFPAITYEGESNTFASPPLTLDAHIGQPPPNALQRMNRHGETAWHPLTLKSQEIVAGIRDTIESTPPEGGNYETGWSFGDEQLCARFFSPRRLQRYLIAYWSMWYPNVPVFHRPTFVAAEKPAGLIASMALIGAALTADDLEREQARYWGPAVEEWVFTTPEFCGKSNESSDGSCMFSTYSVKERLEALQAAYGMILFINWEGGMEQKKQSRRDRFSHVVSVTRSILLQYPMLEDRSIGECFLEGDDLQQNWKAFALREELIRSLLYVFMIDCAYTLFHNTAPRLSVQEMQFPISCPEICFQVTNIDAWRAHTESWANSHIGRQPPLMSDAVMTIFEKNLTPDQTAMFREMSPLNFFAIANTFHGLLFYHRHGIPSIPSSESIINGLHNFKETWRHRQAVLGNHEIYRVGPNSAWRRVGFMRYSMEYWRLALIVLRESEVARRESAQRDPRVYTEFDETNMSQVHDLIMKFQDVNLGEYDI